jgi:hypothetical protein
MIKFICSFFNSKISPPDPLIIFIYLITWTTIGAPHSNAASYCGLRKEDFYRSEI